RPQPFAPLAFVIKSQRRNASRLRLRRLILYVLRTFLFVAVPVALARPEWRRPATPALQRGPAATVVVLDASLSMRYRAGDALFERGRAQARSALTSLGAGEPASLVLCAGGPSAHRAPGLDRAPLLAELEAASPSFEAADMPRCLDAAIRALEESPLPSKRL